MDLEAVVALPVLSVRQPWAAFIVSGIKNIELRSWQTNYRGWIWIHAGKEPDAEAIDVFGLAARDFRSGGLIGLAYLQSCERIESVVQWDALRNDHRSPGTFVEGAFAWNLTDVIALAKLIACRGALGLFSLDDDGRRRVAAVLRDEAAHKEFVEAVVAL